MKVMKRLKTTILASIEELANDMENKEAVAKEVLKEIRKSLADVNIQITTLERKLRLHLEKVSNQSKRITTLKLKAQKNIETDENLARMCIEKTFCIEKKVNREREQINSLKELINTFRSEKMELELLLSNCESKTIELQIREKSLSSHKIVNRGYLEEQDIFQRWEERVIRNELMLNPITKTIGECEVEELLDQEELKEKLENEMNHLKINSK